MKLSKQAPQPDSPNVQHGHIPQPDRYAALLLVDLQNDFFPGGTLAIPGADLLIPLINNYIRHFSRQGWNILATRDWHPAHHNSFKEQQGPLPPHCVQGSRGAQFHSDVVMPPGMMVISKGTDAKKDPTSCFDGTSLSERLEDLNVHTLFVLGLASDDGITQTILDARRLDLAVVLLTDATRWISRHADDSSSLKHMSNAGAILANHHDINIPAPAS